MLPLIAIAGIALLASTDGPYKPRVGDCVVVYTEQGELYTYGKVTSTKDGLVLSGSTALPVPLKNVTVTQISCMEDK